MSSHKASSPVTIIVRHKILAGKQSVFENWVSGIIKVCQEFSGFLGTEIIRSIGNELESSTKTEEYVCIFRFDTVSNLERWMDSSEREKWLAKSTEFSSAGAEYEHYRSIEFMFSETAMQNKSPVKFKMMILTIFGLLLPVHFIPPLVASLVEWPIATTILSLIIIVPIVVYIIMPFLTKILSRWLYVDFSYSGKGNKNQTR